MKILVADDHPVNRRLLQKTAALIEKHGEELAQLITLENGKPLSSSKQCANPQEKKAS